MELSRAPGTFEEERSDVLECALATLAASNCSPERADTCFHLLQHLIGISLPGWATIACSVPASRSIS